MLTLRLTTPTLPVEQGFAGFSAAVLHDAMQRRNVPAATLHHAVPMQSRFRFAAIRWSDACRNALFGGARTVQRLPGANLLCSPPSQENTGPRRGFFAARRASREAPGFWGHTSCTGFRHGGLAAARRTASAYFSRRHATSEFRRVSQRFAERAYRMAFSLASNASSWRFLNG
jgi:hypothetical protein